MLHVRQSHKKYLQYSAYLILAAGVLLALVFVPRANTRATSSDWLSGALRIEHGGSLSDKESDYGRAGECKNESIILYDSTARHGVCVFHAKSYRYAILDGQLHVSIGNDRKYHLVKNIGFSSYMYVRPAPTSDNFIFGSIIWKDLPSKLRHDNGIPYSRYEPTESYHNLTIDNQGANRTFMYGSGVSNNGKWMVVSVQGIGLVRIDMDTLEMKRFATPYNESGYLAISNDGRFVAYNQTSELSMYDLENCGHVADKLQATWYNAPLANTCQERNLKSDIQATLGANFTTSAWPRFSDDNQQLKLLAGSVGGQGGRGIAVYRPNYTPPPPLDYLALGDSYSSGEGDTEKVAGKKHYRSYTDNEEDKSANRPREKCHVSTRSYPYILAEGMNLGSPKNDATTKWQTVACSGAQKYDVTNASNDYLGQGKGGGEGGKPRLEGYANAASLKATALNEFIPGRDKQIEFVKKYKPKVITLTMGGNDIGFGDKIRACLSWGSCDYVTTKRPQLKSDILGQYNKLKSFYEKLYDESGKASKIYVLGYPQFVNGNENAQCGANVQLSDEEREMVSESVSYFNQIIHQAAKSAGVKYVDIENSLEDGRLCDDGQKYVTGLAAWGSSENQESFHPNAKGHFEIAMSVWNQVNNESLLDHAICPDGQATLCPDPTATKEAIELPSYFRIEEDVTNREYTHLTNSHITKGQSQNIRISKYSFEKDSVVTVLAYSEPTEIGQYTASADGELDIEITIPDTLPAGYHTLVLSGKTYSGEPIEYEQIVLVQGSDPSDIDENGIYDIQQPCGPFMIASGTDEDKDGIDDACDPEIGSAPDSPEEPDDKTPPSTDPNPNPDPSAPSNPPAQPNLLQTIISKATQVITTIITFIQKVLKWW